MKLLYGTTNKSKVKYMRKTVEKLGIEIIDLNDMEIKTGSANIKIIEDGKTPLENAKKKAEGYYKEFGIPTLGCDTGLYFEGVKESKQPGLYVRRVGGKELSDNEMIEYYSNLAKENGGELVAWYECAISLIIDEKTKFSCQGISISSEKFIISEKSCNIKLSGFPLDSLSKEINSGKYYLEMSKEELKKNTDEADQMAKGTKSFFIDVLEKVLK